LNSLREIESLWDSVRVNSTRRTLSGCADREHEITLFNFVSEEVSKEQDLHRVVEHPPSSARSCLSKRLPREHNNFHIREKGKKVKSLRGMSSREA